ncbi:transposable element Tcb1 transposase [Trichonephila clavipes]|nr:transposable element Tcb1 transposase [Trichonephila clavipes]
MSRRKQRSAFDQVSQFDRGRIGPTEIVDYLLGKSVAVLVLWYGYGYHSRTPLVRIAGILNSQRYISEVLEPVVLPYLQGLATAIFQQDNARPHVERLF